MKYIFRKLKPAILLALILMLAASCKKTAGEGGQAIIKGKVWVEDWNSGFTIKNGEYAGADREVYIVYGSDTNYGERLRANYNGEFEFKYLRKGKYKIYVYSKDKTLQSQSGEVAVTVDTEISGKKQVVSLDQITIYN